jgi:hypothetical protein
MSSRRGFLRLLGLGAASVPAVALNQKLAAHGVTQLGAGAGLVGNSPAIPTSEGPQRFTDFATWWNRVGLKDCTRQARQVHSFDPDILEMRLPLSTKYRMQRERNLIQIKRDCEMDFLERIARKGVFEWWV